jgi:hypothetical protein
MASKSPDEIQPEQGVEAFLSAPETLLNSEREKTKALVRKAKLKAEDEQLKATKSGNVPTVEDLLADIIRVAEDEVTNPWHKFKTISRKRYRLFGHYPIEFVDDAFGQFEHAKQVAGLEDRPGTRKKKAALAEKSRRDHSARYLERHMLPHVVRDSEFERELVGTKLMLSISDTHATFLDPFTWFVFLSACRDLKPDIVYLNGDIIDGSEISRYPKVPGWTVPLQLELDFAREMFRQIRAVVPKDTTVIWGAGNHGLDRIASYLTQVAPAFAKLRCMRFDQLAGLDELDVKLAMGGSIASPAGKEDAKAGMLLYGFYRIHHGTHLGRFPGAEELVEAGRSGQSGHVHRASLVYGSSEATRTQSWMTTPMGCTEVAGRSYIKGICAGWQKGFGVAWLHAGGHVRQYPVITDNDLCIVEGYVYQRGKDLVEQDPSSLWLERMELK